MFETRSRRGSRVQGHRWRHALVVLLVILVSAATAPGPASAASGGTGLPSTTKQPRPRRHRTPRRHKAHKRKARPRRPAALSGNPIAHRAMWIWELSQTDGGSLAAIITAARQYGIGTLMIKSSDGNNFWSTQFTPQLVAQLHAAHLRVCAWQYVYGDHPITEAYLGARAVNQDHADCLLIDAESEYEGKYIAAQNYVTVLRQLIGTRFPVALAGFPYVDYHPGFPYSVFLGPGGAQDNVPQMYWKDIGTSVDAVFAHTYSYNEIYGRPIFPLGQVYSSPPARQIVRFRQLSMTYHAPGLSWWDWQEAGSSQWTAISEPAGPLSGYVPQSTMAVIGKGAKGDLVVWAQEHLLTAGQHMAVDGNFGNSTLTAVENFQAAEGLGVDGVIGPETWAALLRYAPAPIVWSAAKGHLAHTTRVLHGRIVRYAPVPRSAHRPAVRDELAGAPGAGGRPGP